jgi:hypothetical protein
MVTNSEAAVGIPEHTSENAELNKENSSIKMGQANIYEQIRQALTCVH